MLGEHGSKLCFLPDLSLCIGSLPPQRSDQHQPTSAPPIMQAAAAAGPPLVAATPYSSYISYNPQQFTGQPTMMQPMAHYPSQVSMVCVWLKTGSGSEVCSCVLACGCLSSSLTHVLLSSPSLLPCCKATHVC